MGTRQIPLPRLYELLLGKERDRWPPEARFIEAAHHGDVRKIKKIAKELDVHGHGIPVTVANTTYMGMNALHAAAGCGSFSVFQYLVEEIKMDVDLPDTAQQFTPVAHAVTNGNLPAVKYLIDHGADLHQQRAKGNITLLHAAAVHGYFEIVKFLLVRGADVHAMSDLGTALADAAIRGYPSIVKTLLEHNADPNEASCQFGPLSLALQKSSVSCVKLLVQGGANVSGDSPWANLLVKAAEKGLTEAIKCLLEAGANPNVPNTFGRLPIELAAEYGTREDVEILFPFTSPISTVENWSVDGIISHVKMEIKQLEDDNFVKERVSDLRRQADEAFKKQDYLNASVLYTQAAEKGLTEAIKCLLEAGANPNVPNTFGRLPIELAAEYGTREDVEILFPFTSPISTVENWSVDGIISHVKMEIKQLEDDNFVKERVSDLKRQADEAFKKQDYLNASVLYTQALKMDNFDAKLLSNRSLCWLRMGDGQRAFDDAAKCKRLRPKWAKAHYRQGAALMFMKEYAAAYSALSRALELDPESEEIEKLFWEAMELK